MTRRGRRRLFVLGVCATAGLSLPVWAPRLLATLPAFRVERIEVVGSYYLPPDEVVALAAVSRTASVWDEPAVWEARVRSHPLVREVRISRRGFRRLEVRVVEERPVALAAVPRLVPVSAGGRLLPLDPSDAGLDLPVLGGRAKLEEGQVVGPHRELAALLGRLEEYDPGFVRHISQMEWLEGGAVRIDLLESAGCARILLPLRSALRGLRRVELALSHAAEERVSSADARFDGRVILRLEAGT